jgi:IMP cyclohydrolase
MYVGRYVVVGPAIGAYRVSSRSFPNRKIIERDGTLTVVPTDEAEPTDNPYVSYNCCRTAAGTAVLGNGSHVDPITEKVEMGYPPRDALATGLLALDYEKDVYDTPRLAGVVGSETAHVGIVREDALLVEAVSEATLVATYEKDTPEAVDFDVERAASAATKAYEMEYEHEVCAAGAAVARHGIDFAVENGD